MDTCAAPSQTHPLTHELVDGVQRDAAQLGIALLACQLHGAEEAVRVALFPAVTRQWMGQHVADVRRAQQHSVGSSVATHGRRDLNSTTSSAPRRDTRDQRVGRRCMTPEGDGRCAVAGGEGLLPTLCGDPQPTCHGRAEHGSGQIMAVPRQNTH